MTLQFSLDFELIKYIWQTKSWPDLKWDSAKLLKPLGNIRFSQGALITQIKELGC
ncbi:MAG: DUF4172 domain-containing protein [Desulfobacter sp.]|nr:DUF4172 domain-containing protein [Desulfobacter sp.]WDP84984.1 MAG: DUF4172 domain-containing protein [Desulfobacter sp.]